MPSNEKSFDAHVEYPNPLKSILNEKVSAFQRTPARLTLVRFPPSRGLCRLSTISQLRFSFVIIFFFSFAIVVVVAIEPHLFAIDENQPKIFEHSFPIDIVGPVNTFGR